MSFSNDFLTVRYDVIIEYPLENNGVIIITIHATAESLAPLISPLPVEIPYFPTKIMQGMATNSPIIPEKKPILA